MNNNFWQSDKIKHYKYCYSHTISATFILRPIWGICVFIGVSFYKEIIYDLIMKKGNCDIKDIYANFIGCKDAIINKESRF